MKITVDDGAVRRDIEHLKNRLIPAAREASLAATKEFAERLRKRVQDMIPNKGGWYDIYKRSIVLNETKEGHWELTTEVREILPAAVPAETSVVTISTISDTTKPELAAVVQKIATKGYWTVDTIPAIDGGLPARAKITPASPGEVEYFRRARLLDRPDLDRRIGELGIKVLKFDANLPFVNGRVFADVPFLALRLEYGYGGFPKTPIWSRIDMEGEIISKSKAVQKAGYGTFASRWRQKK
jgi:hypothetical protein